MAHDIDIDIRANSRQAGWWQADEKTAGSGFDTQEALRDISSPAYVVNHGDGMVVEPGGGWFHRSNEFSGELVSYVWLLPALSD